MTRIGREEIESYFISLINLWSAPAWNPAAYVSDKDQESCRHAHMHTLPEAPKRKFSSLVTSLLLDSIRNRFVFYEIVSLVLLQITINLCNREHVGKAIIVYGQSKMYNVLGLTHHHSMTLHLLLHVSETLTGRAVFNILRHG